MKKCIFTAYDMALLYNCKLLVNSIDYVRSCDFSQLFVGARKWLEKVLVDSYFLDNISIFRDDRYFEGCYSGAVFGAKYSTESVYVGFCPDLLSANIVYQKKPTNYYLYSFVINKKWLNIGNLISYDYCIDDNGYVYFPVSSINIVNNCVSVHGSLPSDSGIYSHCSLAGCSSAVVSGVSSSCISSADIERNLDACHSLLVCGKMQSLIFDSGSKIVNKLNSVLSGTHSFSLGESFFYKNIKCGSYISFDNFAGSLYFGLTPNVFYASVISPESTIVSDFFSSVAILKEFVDFKSESPLIKNRAEFGCQWCYFPICRKILCCDNFEELYINRVVEIIVNGLTDV